MDNSMHNWKTNEMDNSMHDWRNNVDRAKSPRSALSTSDIRASTYGKSQLTTKTTRSQNVRKEPEREFFELTVLSYQLRNQEMCPALMSINRS